MAGHQSSPGSSPKRGEICEKEKAELRDDVITIREELQIAEADMKTYVDLLDEQEKAWTEFVKPKAEAFEATKKDLEVEKSNLSSKKREVESMQNSIDQLQAELSRTCAQGSQILYRHESQMKQKDSELEAETSELEAKVSDLAVEKKAQQQALAEIQELKTKNADLKAGMSRVIAQLQDTIETRDDK